MSELITDEIVEAAAQAMHDGAFTVDGVLSPRLGWDQAPPFDRRRWIDAARLALTPAAPLIAARELEEAADAWQRGEWADAPRRADRLQERIANGQYVGDWLRERASKGRP